MGRLLSDSLRNAACSVLPPLAALTAFALPLALGQSLNGIPSHGPPDRISLRVLDTARGYVAISRTDKSGGGNTQIKCLRDVGTLAKTSTADLTVDLGTLDYTSFENMYRYQGEVPLGNTENFTALDADRNGRQEIYGGYCDYSTPGLTFLPRVYEYDASTGTSLYRGALPDSLLGARGWNDLEGDGRACLLYRINYGLAVTTQDDTLSLPFTRKFDYHIGGTPLFTKFFDMTGDGRKELVYQLASGTHVGPRSTAVYGYYIEAYDRGQNTFHVLFCAKPEADYADNFCLGDFDQDGQAELSVGDIAGEWYLIKHQGTPDTTFSVLHAGTLPIKNAYLACFTHDMDGNGRPELWMGGDAYVSGVGLTRLIAFEASGPDRYQTAYTIDLLGVFSFYAGNLQAVDMDHDGKEELLLCIDQHVLIFKSTGLHQYLLWYARTNELKDAGQNSVIHAAWAVDFAAGSYPQILVGTDLVKPYTDQIRYFSRVYAYMGSTNSIEPPQEAIPRQFRLEQNYPNPFNGRTTLRYQLPSRAPVTISIYDILGREVRTLLCQVQGPGVFELPWDGKNNSGNDVNSGVCFVRLTSGGFTRTIKTIIVK